MAFEYPTRRGVLRLLPSGRRWVIEFNGHRRGQWPNADEAAVAAARHRTGLANWDRAPCWISDDLLRWRPLGENI